MMQPCNICDGWGAYCDKHKPTAALSAPIPSVKALDPKFVYVEGVASVALDVQATGLLEACYERNIHSRGDMEYAFQPWALDVDTLIATIHSVDQKIAAENPKLRAIADPKHDETREAWAKALAAEYARLSEDRPLIQPGDPNEPVRLDFVFSDETWAVTEDVMPRVVAQRVLRAIGEWDMQPVPGKRVIRAIIVPLM